MQLAGINYVAGRSRILTWFKHFACFVQDMRRSPHAHSLDVVCISKVLYLTKISLKAYADVPLGARTLRD